MSRSILVLASAVLLCGLASADTAVPPLVNYQGLLTNEAGELINDVTANLEFNIYDAAAGGTKVWGPQRFDTVAVVAGRFNVILGTTDTAGRLITDAFSSHTRYLGMQVNGDPEISPRQQILSAPFAIQAANGVPPGTIVSYYGGSAPDGWLLCNGQTIPVSEKFKAIRALVGDKTPDLRGRGVIGSGRGTDLTDRGIGQVGGAETHKLTIAEMPKHRHSGGVGIATQKAGMVNDYAYHGSASNPMGFRGGDRPHNNMQPYFVLNHIIKY